MLKSFAALSLTLGFAFQASAASVYEYVNTTTFRNAVQGEYAKSVANDAERAKLITDTQEECGGRYEGLEVQVQELSHVMFADREILRTNNPNNYTLKYTVEAKVGFLVVETAKCSIHGGHNRSVIRARIMNGHETAVVNYVYVNDNQSGKEKVISVTRTYEPGELQLKTEYKTPYSVE